MDIRVDTNPVLFVSTFVSFFIVVILFCFLDCFGWDKIPDMKNIKEKRFIMVSSFNNLKSMVC